MEGDQSRVMETGEREGEREGWERDVNKGRVGDGDWGRRRGG